MALIQRGIDAAPDGRRGHSRAGSPTSSIGNIKAAYADLQRARNLEPSWTLPARILASYQVVGARRPDSNALVGVGHRQQHRDRQQRVGPRAMPRGRGRLGLRRVVGLDQAQRLLLVRPDDRTRR